MSDGRVTIDTELDSGGLKSGLNSLGTSIAPALKKITGLIGAAFSIKALMDFGKQSIELASDIQEVQNVVDTAFGEMSYKMEEFADNAIQMYGISKLSAKQTGSTFMAMAKGMGLGMESASDMAIALTGLSADMASFYNVSQDVASTALKSVFTGETETLKKYGIVMTETNLQEFAYSQGINKKIQAMTQAEKVQLRYNYVMQQTQLAQGDFAKTADSWANQTRILSEQWKEFMSIVGTGLIQVLAPAVKVLNQIVSALIDASTALAGLLGIDLNVASTMQSAADSADALADGMESASDATKKAGKEAKKTLGVYDELNVIQKQDTSTGTGAGGGFGDSGLTITSEKTKKEQSELEKSLSKVKKILQDIIDLFKQGASGPLDDINEKWNDIKKNIKSIANNLSEIFTDSNVTTSAKSFSDNLIFSLGQISGSLVSVGMTMAQNIIGGMSDYLEANKEFIKERISSIFSNFSISFSQVGDFSEAFANIFSVFGSKDAQSLTGHLIQIFSNAFLTVSDLVSKWTSDIITLLTQPFIDNQDSIKNAISGMIGDADVVFGTFADGLTDSMEKLVTMYDEHIHPMYESITQDLSDLLAEFLDFWEANVRPVLNRIQNKVVTIWNESLKPLIDDLIEFIGDVADLIKALWKKSVKPFISYIQTKILPVIMPVLETIWTTVVNVFGIVVDTIRGVIKTIKHIVKAFTALITGDWDAFWSEIGGITTDAVDSAEKIFEDLKTTITDIFSGIWESIKKYINFVLEGVETMANGVVDGLNKMIDAMNTLNFDIPEWIPEIGGENVGFNIPHIKNVTLPRLATGAVIPANREFMALLGDQKHGTNIEAPLDTIKQAVAEVLAQTGGTNQPIILQLNGKQIAKAVWDETDKRYKQTGKAFA